MSSPKRVIVEYDDGSRKEASFADLSYEGKQELAKRGLCQIPTAGGETKHYLLLHWKDGWNEVIGMEKAGADLLRYYNLERVECVGRLSVEVPGDYPLLHLIHRLPGELERILLVCPDGVKAYPMQEKVTVKEGGKIEHIMYDKKRTAFSVLTAKKGEAWIAELTDALRVELNRKGRSASEVLSAEANQQLGLYRELSQALGLRATYRQADVYGFVQALVRELAASS